MFGKRLEQLRKGSGLSQSEFGKAIGEKYGAEFKMSQAVVSSYEKGIREPSDFRMYIHIADFFGVTTDYLFGVSDIPFSADDEKSTSLLNEVQSLISELDISSLKELLSYVRYLNWKERH